MRTGRVGEVQSKSGARHRESCCPAQAGEAGTWASQLLDSIADWFGGYDEERVVVRYDHTSAVAKQPAFMLPDEKRTAW